MKLYYIETQNKHRQILIFTSKRDAKKWAITATRWTDSEIKQRIKAVNPRGVITPSALTSEQLSFAIQASK